MIEAVVFDLDGVLIDSEPVWEDVRRGLVAERGGHWPPDAQRRLMGMSTPEWARYLSEDLGVVLPIATVEALAGRPGEVTSIGVTVTPNTDVKTIASRLEARFAGVTAITEPGRRVK